MINLLWKAATVIQDIIAPPFCFYCRILIYTPKPDERLKHWLCSTCIQLIKPIISANIRLNAHYSMPVHAISAYEDPIKRLILAKGYSDYTASKHLAHLIWEYSVIQHIPFDYLVPIPAHWTRVAKRGYNQAQVMAHQLSSLSGKPMLNALTKVKRTKHQAACATHERSKNVKEVFSLADSAMATLIEDSKIVLVDDLMTTGATLHAAATELIQAQPTELYAIVGCRVIR